MLDIEMQMEDEKDIDERATSYMGKLISEQLQVGHKYIELKNIKIKIHQNLQN